MKRRYDFIAYRKNYQCDRGYLSGNEIYLIFDSPVKAAIKSD